MPTVTKTIGPGRDYATPVTAEADIDNIANTEFGTTNLVTASATIVFEVDAGFYNEAFTVQNALTTNETYNITFKAASGSYHNGDAGTGPVIAHPTYNLHNLRELGTVLDGLEIRGSLRFSNGGTIKSCICFNTGDAVGAFQGSETVIVENCLISGNRAISSNSSTTNVTVKNCTFLRCSEGIKPQNGTMVVTAYNNLALAGNSDGALVEKNNSYSQALVGSGNITNQTDFGNYLMPASNGFFASGQTWEVSEDLNASSTGNRAIYDPLTGSLLNVSGNDAWNVLTDLTNAPASSIDGVARSAAGFNPGAYSKDPRDTGSLPGFATNPSPANGADDVSPSLSSISWSEPADSITGREVFFGTSSPLSTGDRVSVGPSPYDLEETLDNAERYFWRVDLTNANGTTEGITFSFDTEPANLALQQSVPGYLFGRAHDYAASSIEQNKTIVPNKRAIRDPRPTTHEGSLNLTRANTYWANPVNFNPTFSSTEKFYEDFSSGDRPFDRSEITRWEWNGPGQYTEVTFDNLAAFSVFSGLAPEFEIKTQQGPQPAFRGTYDFSSIIASSVGDLTIRYRPQFVSATDEPYVDNPEIPWNELVASVYAGSGIQLNLMPSSFIEHAWRAGPESRLPDYDREDPPYMQVKIKVQGLSNFTGGSQGFDWQTGETFPEIWGGLGFSLSANDLYGGTGQHLILSNTKLRSSGNSQWTSNVFNIPLDNSATGKVVPGFCYNRPGDYIWENIDIDGYDEENEEPFYSLKWGTREYALQNRKFFNCDFSRINQEHGSYVGLNGDFLKQGCTLSSIGSQGTQVAHRASPYNDVYPADNNPYDRRCTWTIRDNHYYNMADTALAGERPAFTFTNFSPGNSQFPHTIVAEDCSIVCNFDNPIDSGNAQSGEEIGGRSRSTMVATRLTKDNPDYIFNVISTSVDDFEDLPATGTQDQLIRVTNDASTYHWDGTEWENWGDVSGNPIDKVRVENCLIHTIKQGKNEHILLRSVNEIIFKHNCIIYDKGDDPSWINDEYRINIDAESMDDDGHGLLSTSIKDSNGLRSKKLILGNNIGVGRNGGTIKFRIYHTKYRDTASADNGVVYTYELDATNNLGKYTVIDLEALDVTESTSFADLQVANGNNESSFTTTVDYDEEIHGASATVLSGTNNHEVPPGAIPAQYTSAPSAVTLESPTDGQLLDSVNTVNVDWVHSGEDVNGYKIFVAESLGGLDSASPIFNGDTDRTISNLTDDQTHFVKVLPYNFFGDSSETPTVNSFTTRPRPAQSSGLSPANGASNVNTSINCSWSPADDATTYEVYFALASEDFGDPSATTTAQNFDPGPLQDNQNYKWRVDTVNAYATTQGVEFTFDTGEAAGQAPPQTTGLSPTNGAQGVSVEVDCSWNSVSEASGYDFYFSLASENFGSPTNVTGTTFDPGTLSQNTEYNWRVDSVNEFGTTQGQTFSFTTEGPPAPPPDEGEGEGEGEEGESESQGTQAAASTPDLDVSAFDSRSRQWPTREGDVRAKIFKMTQAKQNISFIYKESLRSMIASFNDIGYFNSEDEFVDIKCIHGNAERAIAKLKQENSIILPMISVSQTVSENDDERRRYESVLVHERYWDKDKHRAIRVLSLAPRPVNINYQVNVWCKYMADMDQILEQIRLKFNPEMNVPTEYSTLAKAFLSSEEAVGSMTANDKDDRVIKKTLNITLRTYIPSPKFLVTSTGELEEFNIDIDIK